MVTATTSAKDDSRTRVRGPRSGEQLPVLTASRGRGISRRACQRSGPRFDRGRSCPACDRRDAHRGCHATGPSEPPACRDGRSAATAATGVAANVSAAIDPMMAIFLDLIGSSLSRLPLRSRQRNWIDAAQLETASQERGKAGFRSALPTHVTPARHSMVGRDANPGD